MNQTNLRITIWTDPSSRQKDWVVQINLHYLCKKEFFFYISISDLCKMPVEHSHIMGVSKKSRLWLCEGGNLCQRNGPVQSMQLKVPKCLRIRRSAAAMSLVGSKNGAADNTVHNPKCQSKTQGDSQDLGQFALGQHDNMMCSFFWEQVEMKAN